MQTPGASSFGWEEGLVDHGPLLLVLSLVLPMESEMEFVALLLLSCGVRLVALVPLLISCPAVPSCCGWVAGGGPFA